MLSYSTTLNNLLSQTISRTGWAKTVCDQLGATVRLRCYRDPNNAATNPAATGTEFLNCAVASLTYDPATGDITVGRLSNVTVKTAADLATGKAVLRLEGNGQWLQGTAGLAGSTADFTFTASPIGAGGFGAAGTLRIRAPRSLPVNDGDQLLVPLDGMITTAAVQNLDSVAAATNAPVTFGQVFKRGAIMPSSAIALKLGSTVIPAQMDVKATHSDGSIRHCVISAVIPNIPQGTTNNYQIVRVTPVTPAPAAPSDFTGLAASVTVTVAGVAYTASLAGTLTTDSPKWLSGNVATEWEVVVPLKNGTQEHPLLHARFYVRGYKGQNKAKIDVVVENTWVKINTTATSGQRGVLDTGMTSVTCDVAISIGGTQVFTEAGTIHYAYARWRKSFWWNSVTPNVLVKHNKAYIVETRALPNYDATQTIASAAISSSLTAFNAASKLMDSGVMENHMPQTGGREDIAILPGWDVRAFLSQHKDAVYVSLETANRAGAFSAHRRNHNNGLPLTLVEAPRYGTVWGGGDNSGDLIDPVTGINWMPYPTAGVTNPNNWESAHTPDPNFIPYLLTGEIYYLEGLIFWAGMVAFSQNPGYRTSKHTVYTMGQIRAQAWSIRTLGHAAYIIPDSHPQKAYYAQAIADNAQWYLDNFVNMTSKPWLQSLGAWVQDAGVPQYSSGPGGVNAELGSTEAVGIATWQDDHFTSSWGRVLELGFEAARPIFTLKAKYPVLRLTSGPDYCYIFASKYAIAAKALSSNGGGMLTTMQQVAQNSIPLRFRNMVCGSQEMADALETYSESNNIAAGQLIPDGGAGSDGTANLMQPSVAYAASFGVPGGADAWLIYSNAPNFRVNITSQPQFNINPRA